MQSIRHLVACVLTTLCALAWIPDARTQSLPNTSSHVPDTMSSEAQAIMKSLSKVDWSMRQVPAPDDTAAWKRLRDAQLSVQIPQGEKVAAREQVTLKDTELAGVPVLEIQPKGWQEKKQVIIYTHGGAYTMSSARGRLLAMPLLANATGIRIISVDYTTAPHADWKVIQAQVISVFKALLSQGYAMKDIALLGDSAGGGLALSTVINLRDLGLGMPASLVLWSPWADLTNRGDTAVSLVDADPILNYALMLSSSAQAYANGLRLDDPRVSPLYADLAKGMPPTLIQEGTRTIFLSTSVRLYRKLDESGQHVVIDMYEGMPHVFQDFPIPEAVSAVEKSAAFILKHFKS